MEDKIIYDFDIIVNNKIENIAKERHFIYYLENKQKQENNTTIIAIAHRLTTLKNCDRIIVLNKGKIKQEGSVVANDIYVETYSEKTENKVP